MPPAIQSAGQTSEPEAPGVYHERAQSGATIHVSVGVDGVLELLAAAFRSNEMLRPAFH